MFKFCITTVQESVKHQNLKISGRSVGRQQKFNICVFKESL